MRRWQRWGPIGLAAVPLALALAARPMLDGHEVLVAQTAREMLASGDWLHPTFSGAARLNKPPLAYWLVAACYRIFGVNESAARLPAALAALAGVALVAAAGTRWFGRRVGLLAGAGHATMNGVLCYGRVALVDSLLSTLVLAGVALAAWDRPRRPRFGAAALVAGFWLVCGLVALAKGPAGLAILLPVALGYRIFRRRQEGDLRLFSHPASLLGVAAFAILGLAWPLAMLRQHPEALGVWYEQSIARVLHHEGPITRGPFYYVPVAVWLTLPWTPFAAWGLVAACRRTAAGPARLLAGWFLFGLLACSAAAGKRPHYLLPTLPALSLLAALGAQDLRRRIALPEWTIRPRAFVAVAAVQAAVIGFATPWTHHLYGSVALLRRQAAALQAAPRVGQFGSNDHWAAFPVGRPIHWLHEPEALARWQAEGPGLLLVPEARLPEALARTGGRVVDRLGAERGWAERDPRNAWALLSIGPAGPPPGSRHAN